MRPEARAEKLGNEALDAELAEDWTTAAEKWTAAALASKGRKKEYAERARQASARTDTPPAEVEEKPAPEPPPFALRHMEAAGEAEGLGDFKLASVEWEMAASRMRGPEKDAALARAEQMRQMVKPEVVGTPAPIETPPTGDPAACGPVFHADEMAEQLAREGDALIAARAAASRDPRLPLPGTVMKKTFRAGGFVVVGFTAGSEVQLSDVDAAHQALLGKPYASVSGLARAYCGRNTSGYEWLGLKHPEEAEGELRRRITKRLESPQPPMGADLGIEGTMTFVEESLQAAARRWVSNPSDAQRVREVAMAIAARRTATLLIELAGLLEDE